MLQRDSGQDYFTFDINEKHEYYRINHDEMDKVDGDIESTIKIINKVTDKNEDTAISSYVAERIEVDESGYLIPKMSGEKNDKEIVDSEIDKTTDGLKESEQENAEDTKPIDDTPNHDTVSNSPSDASSFSRGRRSPPELDRLSRTSDDVFTDCPGCVKLSESPESIQACPECQKTRIELSMFDLHSPDRNDSAISSATSDELQSDDGQSPDTLVSPAQGNMDTNILPEKDMKQKITIRKMPSTKYYDEASIFEIIKKYPAWTEYDRHLHEDSRLDEKLTNIERTYERNGDLLDSHTRSLEPTPYCYSRYRRFSDPYFDLHLNIGKAESWSVAETRM